MSDDREFERMMAAIGVRPIDEEAVQRLDDLDEAELATAFTFAQESFTRVAPAARESVSDEDKSLFLNAMRNMGDRVPNKDQARPTRDQEIRRIKQRKNATVETGQVLDLHGMRLLPALERLQRFIIKAFTHGDQVVMVITGKGHHSKDGVGVLRREVEQWILQHGRRFVRAYSEAPRAYGGRGAYLIYLREA